MEVLCRENLRVPARVWRDAFEGLWRAEPPLDTGPISAPTLIAWGASDSLLPRADQEQWSISSVTPEGARSGGQLRRKLHRGPRRPIRIREVARALGRGLLAPAVLNQLGVAWERRPRFTSQPSSACRRLRTTRQTVRVGVSLLGLSGVGHPETNRGYASP
jgi:hypothetical protein